MFVDAVGTTESFRGGEGHIGERIREDMKSCRGLTWSPLSSLFHPTPTAAQSAQARRRGPLPPDGHRRADAFELGAHRAHRLVYRGADLLGDFLGWDWVADVVDGR